MVKVVCNLAEMLIVVTDINSDEEEEEDKSRTRDRTRPVFNNVKPKDWYFVFD